ncbi:hypothetical protein [Pedobacter nototheniae]|uniref:hypothetical protein n=1 Tax=Pedobacter nototheniae TaxID=2488994 RepID=UPI00103CD572|nr:hypothetical protein [Pedobacter nototheniae]
MKNLELQNFGVLEMRTNEMKSIDGGCPGIEWLQGYNACMEIGNDGEREMALGIFFGLWGGA